VSNSNNRTKHVQTERLEVNLYKLTNKFFLCALVVCCSGAYWKQLYQIGAINALKFVISHISSRTESNDSTNTNNITSLPLPSKNTVPEEVTTLKMNKIQEKETN
jgi:hypothetical protein